jgi:hypothetical protein
MRKATRTEVITCDLCGTAATPIRELRVLHSFGYLGEHRNEVALRISAMVPYSTMDGDVCEPCLRDALTRWLGGTVYPPRALAPHAGGGDG